MKRTSNFGWLELVLGILLVALGIFTFLNPGSAFTSFVYLYGIFAVITGIVDIVLYVRLERRIGFGPVMALIGGIFSILAGILILFNPGAGQLVLAVLFPIWFIAHCISRLANLGYTRMVAGRGYYYFALVVNILGLLLGILLIFNPFASALSLTYIVGFYLLLLGIGSIILAFSKGGIRRS